MKLTIDGPPDDRAPPRKLGARIAWFVGLWVFGLTATAAVAYAMRAMIM